MTPRSSRSLAARDHLDKAALVLAFLAGAVGAWVLKHFGYGPFWAMGWTLGAMLAYVLAVTALGRLRIEPETIGDNCYYLGFLLTLASLSATLYQLTQSEEQTELMRSIIAGFGIALTSTILGILLRVIFVQLRPDIVARDRETRIELQQAARALRHELSSSAALLKDFSTEAIQLAAEQGARISEATDAAIAGQRARMAADVETWVELMRDALAEAGASSVRSIGRTVSQAGQGTEAAIRVSLEEMSRAVVDYAEAQAAALDARSAAEARAAALNRAALVGARETAAGIDALAIRLSATLDGVGADLARNLDAIEAARDRLARIEDAANAAARSAAAAETRALASAEAARAAAEGRGASWSLFGRR